MRTHSPITRAAGALATALVAAALLAAGPATTAEARSYAGSYDGAMYVPATPSKVTNGLRKAAKPGYAAKSYKKGKRIAARGSRSAGGASPYKKSVASGGGGVRWVASSGCLDGQLRSAISAVSSYGSVTVSSTCRGRAHNARVGGARKSHHLTGNAVDFRVHGNYGAAYAYLRSAGFGGVKHYGGGLFHVDTGPKRTW